MSNHIDKLKGLSSFGPVAWLETAIVVDMGARAMGKESRPMFDLRIDMDDPMFSDCLGLKSPLFMGFYG